LFDGAKLRLFHDRTGGERRTFITFRISYNWTAQKAVLDAKSQLSAPTARVPTIIVSIAVATPHPTHVSLKKGERKKEKKEQKKQTPQKKTPGVHLAWYLSAEQSGIVKNVGV
jgi:hypothetical protein